MEAEAGADLVDLRGDGVGVAGRAFEDLDGDRTLGGGAEQTEDDLQRALLAVAAVAALQERITTLLGRQTSVVVHPRAAWAAGNAWAAQEAFRHDPPAQVLLATDIAGDVVSKRVLSSTTKA